MCAATRVPLHYGRRVEGARRRPRPGGGARGGGGVGAGRGGGGGKGHSFRGRRHYTIRVIHSR